MALAGLLGGRGAGLLAYLHQHLSLAAYVAVKERAAAALREAVESEAAARREQPAAAASLAAAVAAHRALQDQARALQLEATQCMQDCFNWAAQHEQTLDFVRCVQLASQVLLCVPFTASECTPAPS